MKARIRSVRAFVEEMLRSRASLTAPGSTTGSMLETAQNSVKGSLFIRDDAAIHNSAHRADERLAFHGLLAMVWATLDQEEQAVLELKHTNLLCAGGGKRPFRRPKDKRERCPSCEAHVDTDDNGRVRPHTRVAEIEVERRYADVAPGDGAEIVKPLEDGWARWITREVVRAGDDDIGQALALGWVDTLGRRLPPMGNVEGGAVMPWSGSQVRSRLKRAFKKIRESELFQRLATGEIA
jgi:hypothetical protein